MKFNYEKFYKWENDTHIPESILNMINFIAEKIGYDGVIEEETISVVNMFGVTIGYAKGFTISHCTSSYADGPSADYSGAFKKWILGLGFSLNNSYGDNGMDSATNWHDTFWHNDFIYTPTRISEDKFIEFEDRDLYDELEEDYDEHYYDYGY